MAGFYLTSDAHLAAADLQQRNDAVAQSSLVEEPFQAVAARSHPILGGIDWAQSPLLLAIMPPNQADRRDPAGDGAR